MALQTFNFSGLPIQTPDYSGIENLPGKLAQAYMTPELMRRQEEERLQGQEFKGADLRAKQLANSLLEKYGAREKEASIAHKKALTKQLLSVESGQPLDKGSIEKMLEEQQRINRQYGEDSPEAKLAQSFIQNKLGGVSSSKVPSPVKTRQLNAQLASDVRGYLEDVARQPYTGHMASANALQDQYKYSKTKDKSAADRLVKGALAQRLVPDIAAEQLASLGINPTVAAKKHQVEAITQGWPYLSGQIFNNLPQELQDRVTKEYEEIINQAKDIRTESFNKILQNPESKQMLSEGSNESVGENQGGTNYSEEDLEYTAHLKGMSVEDVKKALGIL